MPDMLVHWAFERQRVCDPTNSTYYVKCLEGIARGLDSASLQFEVAKLRSQEK
jgi:hypothetical protein